MRRPVQDVRIWALQHKLSRPANPWVVRWRVDGQEFSRSFRTQAEADRRRSHLLIAQQHGEQFSLRTGEPESWMRLATQTTVYVWAREWVAEEWAEWAPRTRRTQMEGLARFVPLAVYRDAPAPPKDLRSHLMGALSPHAEIDADDTRERWITRWSLPLGDLNEDLLADIDRRLGFGDEGQALGPTTAGRFRQISRSCIRRAVELKRIPADPWPPIPKGRARRKARRRRKTVDVKRLPNPSTMTEILAAIPSHQPASRTYHAMTAVAYYTGLRPSEVVMLRPRAILLPNDRGWGAIHVTEADDGYDEPADPKTGERTVPTPPVLVEILRSWIAEHQLHPAEHLFRTRNGRRPTESNWNRALKRAAAATGHAPLCPYDCRHACATTWLGAGVPLGEAARRLGHSVETLVGYYIGALQGDDLVANERIDIALTRRPDEDEH